MAGKRKWDLSPHDLDVPTVIDIGANQGTPALYAAFPGAYLLLVEPVPDRRAELEKVLSDRDGEYVIAAAGAARCTETMYVETRRPGMSSMLPRKPETASGDPAEQRTVSVIPLDEIVAGRDLASPFGLKIDTEGYELEVVRGAAATLLRTAWVIAEVTVDERFHGDYAARELIGELRRAGLAVADVLSSTRRYVDLLFVRAEPLTGGADHAAPATAARGAAAPPGDPR